MTKTSLFWLVNTKIVLGRHLVILVDKKCSLLLENKTQRTNCKIADETLN